MVIGGLDCTASVWDIATGKELHKLEGHTAEIFSVAVSPDGRRIATGSRDRTLKIWEAALPQQVVAWHDEENSEAPPSRSLATRANEKPH